MSKKICSRCKTSKDISYFYKHGITKDGFDCWCKLCRIEYQRKYKDYKNTLSKKKRLEHPEYMQIWRSQNREHIREYDKIEYRKNKSVHIDRSRKRKLLMKKVLGHHTTKEWKDLLFAYDYKCFACGKSNIELTRDHIIPISKGGRDDIENIIPLCRSCNSSKGARTGIWYLGVWAKQLGMRIKKSYKEQLAKQAFETDTESMGLEVNSGQE